MSTTPRLIEVVGSLNIDLISTTDRVPGPGETIAAKSFSTGFGGKGANQAVAAARLSKPATGSHKPVRMIGAVGSDQFGTDFQNQLDKEGIDRSAVAVKDAEVTGTAVIIVEEAKGENRILFSAGANKLVKGADVRLQPGPGLVVFQHELPKETVVDGIAIAKQASKEVVLNPAPAFALPDETLNGLHHLIMNESEAAVLSGTDESKLHDSLPHAAEHFLRLGVQNVIITLGSKGVYWQNNATHGFTPARKVKPVDTTAAGDTFVGAYAVWLAEHQGDISGAIGFANKCASLSVQKAGAQAAIPYLNEVPADG